MRRLLAGLARPESTSGRVAANVGGLGTLGLLPLIMGDEEAKQKLRASADESDLYAPEAKPELQALAKSAAAQYRVGSMVRLLNRQLARPAVNSYGA